MSKIKDLLAEELDIDDLKPVRSRQTTTRYDKAFLHTVRAEVVKRVAEQIYAKTLHMPTLRSWLRANAEYEAGKDDDGHTEWYFENFEDLCEQACESSLMEYIEDQHLDITDDEYGKILSYARDWLADTLSDFESECIQDYVMDRKYILDEVKERNGQC